MKCAHCQTDMGEPEQRDMDYMSLPGVTILDALFYECPECGEEYWGIDAWDALDETIVRVLAEKDGRLTGQEVRFIRMYLGVTGKHFARLMGVKPETVSRWENNKQQMSEGHERLLRYIAKYEDPVDDYDELPTDLGYGDAEPARIDIRKDDDVWKAEYEDRATA